MCLQDMTPLRGRCESEFLREDDGIQLTPFTGNPVTGTIGVRGRTSESKEKTKKERFDWDSSGKRAVLVQGSKKETDSCLHITDVNDLHRGVDVTGGN